MRTGLTILPCLVLTVQVDPATAAPDSCLECHAKTNKTMVEAWRQSKHAAHKVGCADCHGDDHSQIFAVKGRVSAAVCGSCHDKQVKEFDQSLHAISMDVLKTDPKFTRLSPAMAELACKSCHSIGTYFRDGSRGKCNTCHSGHAFSVKEARRPEACAQCHTGPDHAHMEMWLASKHGQLFSNEETRDQAPTCVTCHMPGGTHNTSLGLTFGNVANGAVLDSVKPPVKMRSITAEHAREQRALMVKTCLECHSSRFATESLATADLVKKEADDVLSEAVAIISKLHEDGLLQRPPDAKAGQPKTPEGETPETMPAEHDVPAGPELILGGDQPYDGLSPVEQRFFDMVKFHHASTFKGAYHHSPVHTHNNGFLRMKQDLTFIRNEASRLRSKIRDRAPVKTQAQP